MNTYKIYSNITGVFFGEYPGKNEKNALDNMAKDAGYTDYTDLINQIPNASANELEIYEIQKKEEGIL